jgi:hypothetical protein
MWLQVFLPTDAIVQSEEARIEFDKEPGHDKLKVSAIPAVLSIDHLILDSGGNGSSLGASLRVRLRRGREPWLVEHQSQRTKVRTNCDKTGMADLALHRSFSMTFISKERNISNLPFQQPRLNSIKHPAWSSCPVRLDRDRTSFPFPRKPPSSPDLSATLADALHREPAGLPAPPASQTSSPPTSSEQGNCSTPHLPIDSKSPNPSDKCLRWCTSLRPSRRNRYRPDACRGQSTSGEARPGNEPWRRASLRQRTGQSGLPGPALGQLPHFGKKASSVHRHHVSTHPEIQESYGERRTVISTASRLPRG